MLVLHGGPNRKLFSAPLSLPSFWLSQCSSFLSMSGTRRVTSYAYTSLSVFPSEQLSICLKMSLFHRHFTAVFTERAALGWQSFSFHAPSGWSRRLLVLLSVLKSAVSLIILGRWSIFCFWRLLSCFAVAICYAMAWFFFFFFLLRKTLGLLNLNCSDQFQKIFSHSLQTSPCPFPLLLYLWASAGASRTSLPCPQVSHPLWLHTCLPMPHSV